MQKNMLIRICPVAQDSKKSWPQWHTEREVSPAASATQLHRSVLFLSQWTALWSEEQADVWWEVQKSPARSWQSWLCLVSILVSP